jgi:hypothetical protein
MPTPVEFWIKDAETGALRIAEDDDFAGGGGGSTPTYELDTVAIGDEDVVMAGGIRQDTAGPLADADGKITVPTFDEYNQMRVAAGQIMSSATVTTLIPDSTTPVTVDARPGRIAAAMENTSSAVCYVLCDDAAETPSASLFTKRLEQYDYFELPCGYSGAMRVVWASDPGDGGLMLTEFI